MAAVATALHHHHHSNPNPNQHHWVHHSTQGSVLDITQQSMGELVHAFYAADETEGLTREESARHQAARTIQGAAMLRLIAPKIQLNREALLQRITMENKLRHGLLSLFLSLALFGVVVFSAVLESAAPARLGLLQTFQSIFGLDDSLAEIKTLVDLHEYLEALSARSRILQPLSTNYFSEHDGEVKLFEGFSGFAAPVPLDLMDLSAQFDSLEWTMAGWVQLESEGGAVIVRKPLGTTKEEKQLSCWSWYVGYPYDKFEYGAHDFGGGKYASGVIESISSSNASVVDDGKVHHVALVVTQEMMQFWVDAEMTFETCLPRPVTDCANSKIEIGSADVPTLGEIVFYPHKMSQIHFKEIMFAGFTLEAINEGKVPYVPKQALSDTILGKVKTEFSKAHSERVASEQEIKIESTLSRTAIQMSSSVRNTSSEPKIAVPKKGSCASIPIFESAGHDDTSCHIIDAWEGEEPDNLNMGRKYYNMLPAQVRPRGTEPKGRMMIDHLKPGEYIRYDADAWPSFCGESATFSLWLETETVHGGALLSRYSAVDSHGHSELEYALYAEGYGLCVRGRRAESKHALPAALGTPLEKMQYMSRRHLAYVFDKTADETLTYLDGTLLGVSRHASGTIGKLDCNLTGQTSYTGLGHLAPGVWGIKGPMQDWRYYKGQALSAAEIYKLAEDKTGPAVRTCEHHSEGGDSTWTDIYGHDCAWYYQMRQKIQGVCASSDVQEHCPEACGVKKPCFEEHPHDTTYQMWNRIMKLEDSLHHKGMGLICARQGVDLVDLCKNSTRRAQTPNGDSKVVGNPPGALAVAIPADGSAYVKSYMDIKLTDCDVLTKVVDPYCAFATVRTDRRASKTDISAETGAAPPITSAADVHKTVKANGGYTIEFWFKIGARTRIPTNNEDYKADPTSMRRIVFLSKVSPPLVMAALEVRTDFNDIEFTAYGNCDKAHVASATVDCPSSDPIQAGLWNKISMVYGAKNKYDKRGIKVMRGSQLTFQFMDGIDWCQSDDDFIQAIQLPGGILISPVEVTLKPLPIKELQERYYHHKPLLQVRHGPAVTDKKRQTATIPYDRESYNYPVALMAPPIVLQARVGKTPNCSTVAGTDFTSTLWNHTVYGEKCHFPYDCGRDLTTDPTELLTCKTDKAPSKFFGAHKLGEDLGHMHGLFFEFLQTVAEAKILLRVDKRRRGLFVGPAQPGVSLLRSASRRKGGGGGSGGGGSAGKVAAGGSSSSSSSSSDGGLPPGSSETPGFTDTEQYVEAWYPYEYLDFETEKVEVLLASFSPQYGIASLITITAKITSKVEVDYSVEHYQATEGGRLESYLLVASVGIFIAVLILINKVSMLVTSDHRRAKLGGCVIAVILQVLLPCAWFGLRMQQVSSSSYLVDHTVGRHGLAGIPWQDQGVLLEDKVAEFLSLLHHFEDEVDLEKSMSIFYFTVGAVLLFELILATEAHPRTAMLVETVRDGFDNMVHFFLLFLIITCGYVALGIAQFGYFRPEFKDFDSAFRTLWEMQLGGMMESGELASSKWSHHPLLWLYQMTYMVLNFYIMFNFIIAIIVESYMHVQNEVEEDDTEQAVWTDAYSSIAYTIQAYRHGWPRQAQLLQTLDLCKKESIHYGVVRHLFPAWRDRRSIILWLEYYNRYDFLKPGYAKEDDKDDSKDIKDLQSWLHTELSVMLGVPKPSEYERVQESKRLYLMACRERIRKRDDAAQTRATHSTGTAIARTESLDRKKQAEQRLLRQPTPPSHIVRDKSLQQNGQSAQAARPDGGALSAAEKREKDGALAVVDELMLQRHVNQKHVGSYSIAADVGYRNGNRFDIIGDGCNAQSESELMMRRMMEMQQDILRAIAGMRQDPSIATIGPAATAAPAAGVPVGGQATAPQTRSSDMGADSDTVGRQSSSAPTIESVMSQIQALREEDPAAVNELARKLRQRALTPQELPRLEVPQAGVGGLATL